MLHEQIGGSGLPTRQRWRRWSSGTARRYPPPRRRGRTRRRGSPPGSTVPWRRYRDAIPTAAIVSFRLGGPDGVAVEAAKWQRALGTASASRPSRWPGRDRSTDAARVGDRSARQPPGRGEVGGRARRRRLGGGREPLLAPAQPGSRGPGCDGCSTGRPAVLRHHDLPWQREQFAHLGPPPDDPRWRHVTINELSRRELADLGS